MILVTVGTHEDPFDRMLEGVRDFPEGEEIIVQHGPSAVRPAGAVCHEYMPFDELQAHVRRARVVVSHAGVGSIMVALAAGHRPILVPRLSARGEHVDDHQVPLARRLARAGAVVLVEDASRLAEIVMRTDDSAGGAGLEASSLAADLRGYLETLVGAPGGAYPPS